MRNAATLVVGFTLAASACSGSDGAPCDREAAQAALDASGPGDTVTLGACEVAGPLRVPASVRLAGVEGTVVVADEASAAVILTPGVPATELASLTVRATGRVGVLASGAGDVSVDDVTVVTARGVGAGFSGLGSLSITTLTIAGPVTAATASSPEYLRVIAAAPAPGECPAGASCECTPGEAHEDGRVCDSVGRWARIGPAYGLYVDGVADAVLTDVDVSGLAEYAVVLRESNVRWTSGSVGDNLGVGIRQIRGSLAIDSVSIESTLQGVRGTPAYAFAATDGATIDATSLSLLDNERYGLLLLDGAGTFVDLVAERNADAAIWCGSCDGFAMRGTATMLADNGFAGVVVAGSRQVQIDDAVIVGTRTADRPVGEFGVRRVGDGLHLLANVENVTVERVALRDNGRAGLVVDLGTGTSTVVLRDVTVDGSGDSLGAVAGRADGAGQLVPVAPGGWDDGITRMGATVANDAAAPPTMDAVGVGAPSDLPGISELGVIAPMF
jgi:hypothetical protein